MRYIIALLTLSLAFAQPTAHQVLLNLALTQRNAQDYRAHISGTAQLRGQPVKLDLTLERINALELSRLEFAQPEVLGGNIVVSDKGEVKTYLALTNQVVATKGQTNIGLNLNQLMDVSSLLAQDRSELKLVSSETLQGRGTAHVLELQPSNTRTSKVRVWVLENPWRPYRIQTLDTSDAVLNDLTFSEFQTNVGLSAQKLRALPLDAEVVNK